MSLEASFQDLSLHSGGSDKIRKTKKFKNEKNSKKDARDANVKHSKIKKIKKSITIQSRIDNFNPATMHPASL